MIRYHAKKGGDPLKKPTKPAKKGKPMPMKNMPTKGMPMKKGAYPD